MERRETALILLLLCLLLIQVYTLQVQQSRNFAKWRKLRAQRQRRSSSTRPIPYVRKRTWSIKEEGWTDADCIEYLRFTKKEIGQILLVLNIPTRFRFRYRATSEMALCVFLYRMAHPFRLKDCMKVFGKSRSWISAVFNDVSLFLVEKYEDRLLWDSKRLHYEQLRIYADSIEEASGARNIWGFIDGTHRGIGRPIRDQEEFYAGAKKEHGIRYQGIVTPDGLITSLAGPWRGPTGDWRMWSECGVDKHLRALFQEEENNKKEVLYLYGDPAYYPGYGIMGPFRPTLTRDLTAEEEAANILMSGERIVVEWAFGLVTKAWSFTAFKKMQKVGLSPVGAYYFCAVLFTNIQTCIRGRNQISDKYGLRPPRLNEYLA